MKKTVTFLSVLCLLAIGGFLAWRFYSHVSAPAHSNGRYVALGDSVAAGDGLAPVHPSPADTACGRSPDAYSTLVAKQLHYSLKNVACSSAATADMSLPQTAHSQVLPAQLDTAFAGGTPQLLSLTIGANDIHWVEQIANCFKQDCTSPAAQARADAYLSSLSTNLSAVLQSIAARSGSANTAPPTYLTGYYQLAGGDCATGRSKLVTPTELTWVQSETDKLNQTIRSATAAYPFAHYVSIDFGGHGLCSDTPWVQNLGAAAPLHPTVVGQAVIAAAIIAAAQ